jgi:transcriptional regulator with XRE-family HTH domain
MKPKELFRKTRKALKLNQSELAKLLNVRNVNLCKYELGYTDPPAQLVIDVYDLLKRKGIRI